MSGKDWISKSFVGMVVVGIVAAGLGTQCARAGDLKITIPKRSTLTPVQRLNRDGVDAVRKHNYAKAEELFYKAYLFDPDDPFTLNNLGYVSELQGQIDRAERFYSLAAEQSSDAIVDRASTRRVEGRPMREALAQTDQSLPDQALQMNHANVEAVRLLAQGRAAEADLLLQTALKQAPHNVFTLNNLGVAKEMEGEDQEALQYYDEAAGKHSDAAAVVTVDRVWRGRPVSAMAQQNAKTLREHLARTNDRAEQVAEFNLRGVSAVNRNDLPAADGDFRKAYALDPNNAFTLNNIGYVAEVEGDRETAEFFYDRARQAGGANATVGVATRRTEEGKKLFAVAADSNAKVEAKVTQDRDSLRRQHEPVVLRRRDNSIVDESAEPPAPSPASQGPQQ
jgi:Flp pilus assembly protein TadD